MSKIKIIFAPLFVSLLLYLFFQFLVINIFTGLLDEGYLLYNTHLILIGKIPYRDFFMTTTPGSFYINALFFKLIGEYIIIDRILGIVAGVMYLIVYDKLFLLKKYWRYVYLISMAIISIAPARAFFYNDALLFLFIALYFFFRGIEKKQSKDFLITGILAGICFIFKQSIGGLLIPAIFLGIIATSPKRDIVKQVLVYLLGVSCAIVPISLYFYVNHTLFQAYYYIFKFAAEVKGHESSFLLHRLIIIPIIIIVLKIIYKIPLKRKLIIMSVVTLFSGIYIYLEPQRIGRIVTYLADPVFYWESIAFLYPLVVLSFTLFHRTTENKKITVLAIFYLVIFLSIAASGYNVGPAIAVAPLGIPMTIMLFEKYKKLSASKYMISILSILIFYYILLFAYNPFHLTDPKFGSYKVSEYTTSLNHKSAAYIKYPVSEATELKNIIDYIQKNTKPKEKIFCFPYCPGMYFYTQREGGSYYNLFYFETFLAKDQNKVITDLRDNHVNLIVLQKIGVFEQRKDLEKSRLPAIMSYLIKNYHKVYETSDFIIMKK